MPCCSRWRRNTEGALIANELKLSVVSVLPVPPYVWLLCALCILIIFPCLPIRRLRKLIVWSLVILIVWFVTLTGACYVGLYDVTELVVYMAVMIVLMISLLICGANCRKPCLPNVLFSGVIVALCLAALFPLGILSLLSHRYYFVGFSGALFILGLTIVPLQAQFIHGRLRYVPLGLEPICSLGIFIDAWILVFCLCVFGCTIEIEIIGGTPEHLGALSTIPK
ncbi:uncharacterized protein [Drosophila takahashii]|uniref:uncharacterized protein isoform X2 n=1 Tax=Drosophila takahashii TaxID=29030 RepID=UPI0007E7C10E|nr:uncharacterized protein LOC108068263 [Drosophila takahashii]